MNKTDKTENLLRYSRLIEKQMGKAVKPFRGDGFVNVVNRYGTEQDVNEHYQFKPEPTVPDETLSEFYEGNGLFAKIIDAPAEEAIRHGFELEGITDQSIIDFYSEALDELDWEETAITAIKWARLFGGSIAVMLINDGRGIDEPLDWRNIRSIDDIRVYDRSVIQPDYESMFTYSPEDPFRTRGSRLGMPERYHVYSKYGQFTVHESRCLVFRNGVLPENCTNSIYELWGMPEYIRIRKAIIDSEVAHRNGPKLLEKSVQPVYKMKDLAAELSAEGGDDRVLKRLHVIDTARGVLNSIAIDAEGEDYDFKSFQFNGVAEIIDSTCNQLSALTSIPQTILFGRSPAGMNATGASDLENWYNFVERIQKRMLRSNLRYLLSIIFQAGVYTGEVEEVPAIKPKFNPLWSLSELEEAQLDQTKAATQQTKASTTQVYVSMGAIDPSEVRTKLAEEGEYDVEDMLDEYTEEELFENMPEPQQQGGPIGAMPGGGMPLPSGEAPALPEASAGMAIPEQEAMPEEMPVADEPNASDAAPEATKLPEDQDEEVAEGQSTEHTDEDHVRSVGVIITKNGKFLCAKRHNDYGYGLFCGAGGHIEEGETPEEAAIRETQEEFGITPLHLMPIGVGPLEEDTDLTPMLYLCTEYDGDICCMDLELTNPKWRTIDTILADEKLVFKPFYDGIMMFLGDVFTDEEDADENISDISEKTLDKSAKTAIINVQENTDGAPKGNKNAAGPHKMSKLSKKQKDKLTKRIVGQTTSDGVQVSTISEHAFDRIAERKISPKRIENMLSSASVSPDKQYPERRCYDYNGSRLVLDVNDGTIVTVEWRRNSK